MHIIIIRTQYNNDISYDGLALDSVDFASTVEGVDISMMELTGVVATGVDVFFPAGVSLSPQGERVPTIKQTQLGTCLYV